MAGKKGGALGFLSQPQAAPGASGWSPTLTYLFILIVAEMVIFGFISRTLR
jgi:hypothetical protein